MVVGCRADSNSASERRMFFLPSYFVSIWYKYEYCSLHATNEG